MSMTPRQAIGDDLIALRSSSEAVAQEKMRDATTPPKTASVPITPPLQSAEDRSAIGAAAIEIDLIKQNMEIALTRLGEIADDLEARLNRKGGQ